eukprot:106976_1
MPNENINIECCESIIEDLLDIASDNTVVELKWKIPVSLHDIQTSFLTTNTKSNVLTLKTHISDQRNSITIIPSIDDDENICDQQHQPHKSNSRKPLTNIKKSDINYKLILTVEWFINEFQNVTNVRIPTGIVNLIIFVYAKPIAAQIKYKNKTKYLLVCLISDRWNSVKSKILSKFEISTLKITELEIIDNHIKIEYIIYRLITEPRRIND